jgi:hypothetical protein
MSDALSNYPDKFWLMLTAVTAFVAAQGIAVSISDWSRKENNLPAIIAALARDLMTLALYAVAIYWLTRMNDLIAKPGADIAPALE